MGKKLNKTLYKGQTVEMVKEECSLEEPCLVWLAWDVRNEPLVLECPPLPQLDTSIPTPSFEVTRSVPVNERRPSAYLQDGKWVDALKATAKGVTFINVEERHLRESDVLVRAMEQRLDMHLAARVHKSKRRHWTVHFVRDNLARMAAAMMLTGHMCPHLASHDIRERMLNLSSNDEMGAFSRIESSELLDLEGSYLYFDTRKKKWVRSGKTSGLGKNATFRGRGQQHIKNSRSIDQMKMHDFYRIYPAEKVPNLGGEGGYFEYLQMYCAMAFDRKGDVTALCSEGESNSLFAWSKETLAKLTNGEGNLKNKKTRCSGISVGTVL